MHRARPASARRGGCLDRPAALLTNIRMHPVTDFRQRAGGAAGGSRRSAAPRALCAAVVAVAAALGCAAPQRGVLLPDPASPNLLGPPAGDRLALAQALGRARWPVIDGAYVFDEVQTFTDVFVDDEYAHTRFGGFYRFAESVRTGVRIPAGR